jgi:recombinational DNA repair protein RecT
MTAQTQVIQTQQNTSVQNNNPVKAVASDALKKLLLSKEDQVSNLLNAALRKTEPGFAEKLIGAFYLTVMRDEKLRASSSHSMVKALYFCAEKALLPISGKIWLVPFKGECTPVIGVQGYRELLRRNPQVIKVTTDIVTQVEKDNGDFRVTSGTTPHIHHVPNIFEKSPVIATYATAEIRGTAEKVFRICSIREINEAKKCNPGSENPKSVWNKSPNEMMRLVPLRKLAKELMVEKESDFLEEDNAPQYSDNVVPFVPSANYNPQSAPDYDYDYEGYPS